jgi:hypothetical protein
LTGLESGIIKNTELYNLDDQSLFNILQEKTSSHLVKAVREGKLYTCIGEIPFTKAENCLRDIESRHRHETQLCDLFRSAGISIEDEELVIDIPEPISFETGLFVMDEEVYFADSSSAFKTDVLDSFIKNLYTIRIFVNPEIEKEIKTLSKLNDILNNIKNWLYLV